MKTPSSEVWPITVAWFCEHRTLHRMLCHFFVYNFPGIAQILIPIKAIEHNLAMLSLTTEFVLLTCVEVSTYCYWNIFILFLFFHGNILILVQKKNCVIQVFNSHKLNSPRSINSFSECLPTFKIAKLIYTPGMDQASTLPAYHPYCHHSDV